jgi:hypothetical protein
MQICRAISVAFSSGKRPMRRSSDDRSSPATNSIDKNNRSMPARSLASPTS